MPALVDDARTCLLLTHSGQDLLSGRECYKDILRLGTDRYPSNSEHGRRRDLISSVLEIKRALAYDVYLNGDESESMVIERYWDSEAAMRHAAHLGRILFEGVMAVALVYGEFLGDPRT